MSANIDTPEIHKFTFNGKNYILEEAGGRAARIYRKFMLSRAQALKSEGGADNILDLVDIPYQMLPLCIKEENGGAVSEDTILDWPTRLTDSLFDKLKEISKLDWYMGATKNSEGESAEKT